MSLVNLNKARNAKARETAKKQADRNAVKFGRTKAETQLEKARQAKTARDHDAKKRDR